jgi:CheY-like chemotaxis protein
MDTGSRLNLAFGKYVKISIKDSGTGISKEHLPNIFTPYFTTKKSGTGLGLATSYSIVSKHNGLITVESKPGAGTTFHIYLPASDREQTEAEKRVEAEISGSGRILVMDDNEIVLAVTKEALSTVGYTVDEAPGGAEAIDMYLKARASGEPYDLIIMDLTIPGGMGGAEAVKKLLEKDPGAKAIAASGYANDAVMSNFRAFGFKGMLVKPFRINELCQTVHHVIHDDE